MTTQSYYKVSDKHYKMLFASLRESILVVNSDRTILNSNPAFSKLFGYTLKEMFGKKPEFLYAVKNDYRKIGELLKHTKGNKLIVPEIKFKKKTGETFSGEVTFSFAKDSSGKKTSIMGMVRDITEKKRRESERELLLIKTQQEKRLHFLAEATAIFSSSLDYKKTISHVANLIVPKLADWCVVDTLNDQDELTSLVIAHQNPKKIKWAIKLREKFPPDKRGSTGVYHVIRTGKSELYPHITNDLLNKIIKSQEQLKHIKKVGMTSVIIAPLKGHEKIFGTISFISTDSKRLYTKDDLLLAEQIANRAGLAIDNSLLYERAREGIRARDEFLNIASHELKTPLTSLQLQLQLLSRRAHSLDLSQEPLTQSLEMSERQVKKLSQLINNLLDVSRMGSQKLALDREAVNLSLLIHDVIERLNITATQAKTKIILHNSKSIVGQWDKIRVDQIATNLLTNAIKYGLGKPVTVKIGKRGETAFLLVKDHGLGIPQKEFGKIFNRFERTENARRFGGLGMGLYIVNQLVQAHNGEVEVESTPGKGSEFKVLLPLRPQNRQ